MCIHRYGQTFKEVNCKCLARSVLVVICVCYDKAKKFEHYVFCNFSVNCVVQHLMLDQVIVALYSNTGRRTALLVTVVVLVCVSVASGTVCAKKGSYDMSVGTRSSGRVSSRVNYQTLNKAGKTAALQELENQLQKLDTVATGMSDVNEKGKTDENLTKVTPPVQEEVVENIDTGMTNKEDPKPEVSGDSSPKPEASGESKKDKNKKQEEPKPEVSGESKKNKSKVQNENKKKKSSKVVSKGKGKKVVSRVDNGGSSHCRSRKRTSKSAARVRTPTPDSSSTESTVDESSSASDSGESVSSGSDSQSSSSAEDVRRVVRRKHKKSKTRGKHTNIVSLRKNKDLTKAAEMKLIELGLENTGKPKGKHSHTLSRHMSLEDLVSEAKCHCKGTKSGITTKPTDRVTNPQIWAHSALQFDWGCSDINFDQLNFVKLVAGELEIITSQAISKSEKKGRLRLLKKITYYAENFDIVTVRSMYSAVLHRIELGLMDWSSDFSGIEHMALTKQLTRERKKQKSKDSEVGVQGTASQGTWFCHNFNKDKCGYKGDHN